MNDLEGRVTFANTGFADMIGDSVEHLIGRSLFDLVHPEQRDRIKLQIEKGAAGATHQGELDLIGRHGSTVRAISSAIPLRATEGPIGGQLVFVSDVTEQRRVEAQRREIEKLAAIGRLAAGIAHAFNDLLTVSQGHAQLLLEELPPNSHLRRNVEAISNVADRGGRLTQQLLAVGRRQVLRARVVELDSVVLEVQKVLKSVFAEDMEILTQLNAPRAHVRVDPLQIERVLFELAAHARAARIDPGVLLIDSDTVYVGPAFVAENPGSTSGEHVCLTVRNTGASIDADMMPHIFEPFFAGEDRPDTGLGLAAVFGIVQQSGGFIHVQTKKGRGTAFEMYFPRVYDPLLSGPALIRTVPSKARDVTILVAEDDDAVRDLVVQILRKRGYHVLEASNGEQAQEIAQHHAGAIDLLLTDIVMPILGGYALHAQMQELHPAMKTLYMSGYASDDLLQRGFPADEGLHLLEKPFTPGLLLEKLREALGSHQT